MSGASSSEAAIVDGRPAAPGSRQGSPGAARTAIDWDRGMIGRGAWPTRIRPTSRRSSVRTWHDGSSLTDEYCEAARDHGRLPAPDVLETILSTCYQASLLREEERPVRFRLIVANAASFPAPAGPPQGRHRRLDLRRSRDDLGKSRRHERSMLTGCSPPRRGASPGLTQPYELRHRGIVRPKRPPRGPPTGLAASRACAWGAGRDMNWLFQLHDTHVVAHAIGVLALVCGAGMALGSVKVRGIGLGTAGVLFAGIVAGHFGKPVDHATLDFVKEFGLILFVFTIGLQLGPGFFAALRRRGPAERAGGGRRARSARASQSRSGGSSRMDPAGVLGMLAGATTNTPSLGAAQQTLGTLPGVSPTGWRCRRLPTPSRIPRASPASSGALLVLKRCSASTPAEAEALAAEQRQAPSRWSTVRSSSRTRTSRAWPSRSIPARVETGVVVSRHRPAGETDVRVATGDTLLRLGDSILAVGTPGHAGQVSAASSAGAATRTCIRRRARWPSGGSS